MDLKDWAKYGDYLNRGRVFCVDCGGQITIESDPIEIVCMTYTKNGIAKPELDANGKLLIITDADGDRAYAEIHPPFITDD